MPSYHHPAKGPLRRFALYLAEDAHQFLRVGDGVEFPSGKVAVERRHDNDVVIAESIGEYLQYQYPIHSTYVQWVD